jgi:hypothetical protein
VRDETTVTDGEHEVTADELVNGQLYVMIRGANGKGHLKQVPRNDDELPRLRITEEALAGVRDLCRGMRKEMGGYRPDVTLVASALLLDAVSRPEAPSLVRHFAIAKFQSAGPDGAQTEPSIEEDVTRS